MMVMIQRLIPISGIQCERYGGRIIYYPVVGSKMQCWLDHHETDVIHCVDGKTKRLEWLCTRILNALHQVASANSYPYAHYHWYIQGNIESVMDDATMLEAMMVYALAKTNAWMLDCYGLAMMASKVANTIDPNYYGFADLYAYMISFEYPDQLIYIDTLMASYRLIQLNDIDHVHIYRTSRDLIHRQVWLDHFKKYGLHAFETLGIFYPIHSLASVSSVELSESKFQLDKPSYQVASYVIDQSELSDAIASYRSINAKDCIKLLDDMIFRPLWDARRDKKRMGTLMALDPFIKPVAKRIPYGHYWYWFSWM